MGFLDLEPRKGAELSPCGLYRYTLTREWAGSGRRLCVVGLNPSKADALVDDRTCCRCMSFAADNGFSRLVMVNLFGLRSTDPYDMLMHQKPIGEQNDHWIKKSVETSNCVLLAWGTGGDKHRRHPKRPREVYDIILEAMAGQTSLIKCLGVCADGSPRHPLYIPAATPMEPFEWKKIKA